MELTGSSVIHVTLAARRLDPGETDAAITALVTPDAIHGPLRGRPPP